MKRSLWPLSVERSAMPEVMSNAPAGCYYNFHWGHDSDSLMEGCGRIQGRKFLSFEDGADKSEMQ